LHIYFFILSIFETWESDLSRQDLRLDSFHELDELPPNTRSGGSMHSNGSKGVRELFFFYSEMWVFFFYGMRDALGPNPIPLDFSGDSPPTG
jgi:hypothetical protein